MDEQLRKLGLIVVDPLTEARISQEVKDKDSASRIHFAQACASELVSGPVPAILLDQGVDGIARVIVFGSTVRREAHDGRVSDVDLCVTYSVNPDTIYFPERLVQEDLKRYLRTSGQVAYRVDLVVFPEPGVVDPAYFRERPIWDDICDQGVVLYSQKLKINKK